MLFYLDISLFEMQRPRDNGLQQRGFYGVVATSRSVESGLDALRPLSQARCDELIRLGAATLHEAQGQQGAMDHLIKPIDPAMRVAGRALTVKARPADNLIVYHALSKARPGDVLVIDAAGFLEAGLWGDILTEVAMERGVAGVIVDGAVRDADAICALGFPIFARGLSIKGTLKHQPGLVNAPVTCGGVRVRAGDVVVGDRDGVVVIPTFKLEDALQAGRERELSEEGYRKHIRQGVSAIELFGLGPVIAGLGLT